VKSVYLFRPDANRFNVLTRPGKQVTAVYDALREGKALPKEERKFEYERGDRDGDFPLLAFTIPVLSERAYEILRPIVDPWTSAQEIFADDFRFQALSVTHVLDCIDQQSTPVDIKSYAIVSQLDKIHLHPNRLDESNMFRMNAVSS